MQTPTDPNRRCSVEDVSAIQRNRFETLREGFLPNDLNDKRGAHGRPEVNAHEDGDKYKYAPGNDNVVDAHYYQVKKDLPSSMSSIMWLSSAPSRNTPYSSFYGTVTDTCKALKPKDGQYNKNSFYWVAWHIDQMVAQNWDIFGSSIKEKWQAPEKEEIAEQAARDAKYTGETDADAKAASKEVTKDSLERTEKLFKQMRAVEKEMTRTNKEKGGTDKSIQKLANAIKKQDEAAAKTESAANGVTATVSNSAEKTTQTTGNQIGLYATNSVSISAVFGFYYFQKKRKK